MKELVVVIEKDNNEIVTEVNFSNANDKLSYFALKP